MNTEQKFINNLVKARKAKNLSQRELADITGLTQQAISSIERRDRVPTLPNLIKYLNGLNIDINEVFRSYL